MAKPKTTDWIKYYAKYSSFVVSHAIVRPLTPFPSAHQSKESLPLHVDLRSLAMHLLHVHDVG
jgi:hypothetical protein